MDLGGYFVSNNMALGIVGEVGNYAYLLIWLSLVMLKKFEQTFWEDGSPQITLNMSQSLKIISPNFKQYYS